SSSSCPARTRPPQRSSRASRPPSASSPSPSASHSETERKQNMTHAASTQVQLVSRPHGWPTPENFRTVVVEFGDLAPGEVRVHNAYVSVDPYMRGRMNDVKSYVPPFALGETMTGGAIGRVVESAADSLPVGTLV